MHQSIETPAPRSPGLYTARIQLTRPKVGLGVLLTARWPQREVDLTKQNVSKPGPWDGDLTTRDQLMRGRHNADFT